MEGEFTEYAYEPSTLIRCSLLRDDARNFKNVAETHCESDSDRFEVVRLLDRHFWDSLQFSNGCQSTVRRNTFFPTLWQVILKGRIAA